MHTIFVTIAHDRSLTYLMEVTALMCSICSAWVGGRLKLCNLSSDRPPGMWARSRNTTMLCRKLWHGSTVGVWVWGRGEGFAERINILDSEDVVEDGVLPSRLSFLHMFSLPPMYAGLSSTLATYCEREREHTQMHLTQRYIGTFT